MTVPKPIPTAPWWSFHRVSWWMATLLLLGGCRPAPALTVNGQPIPLADVEAAARVAGTRSDDPELLEGVILERLLLQDAAALGIEIVGSDLDAALAQATEAAGGQDALLRRVYDSGFTMRRYRLDLERRLIVTAYHQRLSADLDIPDSAVAAHYQRNRARFTVPERFGAILLNYPDRGGALAARDALLAGQSLEQARAAAGAGSGTTELSASETAPTRMRLLAAARTTPFGTPSEPVIDGDRFVLVIPSGHYRAYEPAFDDIAVALRAQLEQQTARALLHNRLEELRAGAIVRWGTARPSAVPQ